MSAPSDPTPLLPLYVDPRAELGDPSPLRDRTSLTRWVGAGGARAVTTGADVAGVAPGDLVAVRGRSRGNPMLTLLDFVGTSLPLVLDAAPSRPRRAASRAAGAGDPAAGDTAAEQQRVMAGVVAAAREQLRSAAVLDVVLVTDAGLTVVLVLPRASVGAECEALLQDGTFEVVGKVTAVVGEGAGINLLRRSVLGAGGPEPGREVLGLLEESGLQLDVGDPLVTGPTLQVLPLAVLL